MYPRIETMTMLVSRASLRAKRPPPTLYPTRTCTTGTCALPPSPLHTLPWARSVPCARGIIFRQLHRCRGWERGGVRPLLPTVRPAFLHALPFSPRPCSIALTRTSVTSVTMFSAKSTLLAAATASLAAASSYSIYNSAECSGNPVQPSTSFSSMCGYYPHVSLVTSMFFFVAHVIMGVSAHGWGARVVDGY
ncbi:hypothetical protein EON66_01150 [archaeon]|nr:MAG: hypothetical protein EON66_01150 [archaeon]